MYFFFFKQKTAYEMRISDWSSDVCSSDLALISAIDRALHLCAQTLQFTREGPAQLNLQRFDLRDLLTEVREAVAEVGAGRAGWINRSEERRGGKECVSTCRSRWSPYH